MEWNGGSDSQVLILLTSLRLSNDTQALAGDAPGRLDGPIPRGPNRYASEQDEQKRHGRDECEEGDEQVRALAELAVRRGRHQPEHEEADGHAHEKGPDRVQHLGDGRQEEGGADLSRLRVRSADVSAHAVVHLEDCDDALRDGEGLEKDEKMKKCASAGRNCSISLPGK